MQVEPGMLVQPGHDVVVGVGAVVVEDHVDLESLWDLTVNGAQELQELAVAVPGKTLADHHSGQHVQRGEQGRCPVALVVVGHGSGPARLLGWSGANARTATRRVADPSSWLTPKAPESGPRRHLVIARHRVREAAKLLDQKLVNPPHTVL